MKMKFNIEKFAVGLMSLVLMFTTISVLPVQASSEQNMTKIFTLDSFISEVLNNNPEIKLLDGQIQVQEKRIKTINEKADQERVKSSIPDEELAQNKTYVLLYPLQAKNKLEDLKWEKKNKAMSLKASAVKLYYQYMFKQKEIDAKSKAVERAKAELEVVREKVKLGKENSLSLTQNENSLELANQQLVKLKSELQSIILNINSLLNYDLDQKIQFNTEEIKIDEYTIKDIEALIEKRKAESNSILKLQRDIEEAKVQYYIESYNRQSLASSYEQLADKPKELENEISKERYNIEEKIRIDYNNILAAYEDIKIEKLSNDLSVKKFEIAEKKYKQGMASYIDFMKALEEKENAASSYDQTQLKYITAVLDFKLYIEEL